MTFKSEQQMYPIIADHFSRLGYDTRIDSPEQNSIKFDLLKGWTIDVTGMRKREGTAEVIAVEAKNDVDAQSVTQAISQAEMYKNVCTKVYVAFPDKYLNLKENRDVTREIQELCETKGIGLLSVRRECKEIVKAPSLPLRIHMYNDIINQFKGTARHSYL